MPARGRHIALLSYFDLRLHGVFIVVVTALCSTDYSFCAMGVVIDFLFKLVVLIGSNVL